MHGNLREVVTSRKVTWKITNVEKQNRMVAGGGIFGLARRPRSYNNRPSLVDMAECEVLERFQLSRERIQWLVDELQEELERNTARSCQLSPEAQIDVLLLLLSFTCLKSACLQLHISAI